MSAPESGVREAPLSFAQQRLWFLDRLLPGATVYNMPMAYRLRGPLDPAWVAAALTEIVRRHEILRTRFTVGEDGPLQRVDPPGPPARGAFPLPQVDLAALAQRQRADEEWRLLAAEAVRPFDLQRGPLLRSLLVRLAAEEWVLLLSMHHIVSDAWSLGVMLRELAALYAAAAAGAPSPLAGLPVQYADYTLWQNERLRGKRLTRQLDYWRAQLAAPLPVLELPTDRPRPALQGHRGAAEPLEIDPQAEAALRRLAAGAAASLYMAALAGFLALLARHTGQTDLVVGTPWAARPKVELEGLIGFFVNTLPLRCDLGGDPSFRSLLERVKATAMAAFANGEVPFERLVEELAPDRDLSRSPLLQATFLLHAGTVMDVPRLAGVELEQIPVAVSASKLDLAATLEESNGGLRGELRYNPDLVDATTVRRMARHLEAFYAAAAASPYLPLSALPSLSAAERQALRVEWNDTGVAGREDGPWAHQLFAGHARLRPTALAVAQGGRSITYGELEERANRLAHTLRAHGVGPDVPVALCAGRSLERVIGMVAALKAGGAFVSLDPAYPIERLERMLRESRAPVVLTESSRLLRVPVIGAKVLCLDHLEPNPEDEANGAAPPEARLGPANLAYVVYTSGSTVEPKGIGVPHAGLRNLILWHAEAYGTGPEDRGTIAVSPAFDPTVMEVWCFLAAGASLAILDDETRLSAAGTLRFWAEEGVTLAYLPTPLAEALVEELEEGVPRPPDLKLRVLALGGDRLRRPPGPDLPFALSNLYGPAEVSVNSTEGIVSPVSRESAFTAPSIGRPLAGIRAYVLDGQGREAPVGVSGELFLGGVGLARGYLRRPDLTAERFLPDPLAGILGEAGARLYRTGDLVRWRCDGKLDFLGRADHQVKLRGMRVELGEIEAVLSRRPEVREAVVLARPEEVGGLRIVAYVVPVGAAPDPYEFRENLNSILPEYMVPSAFVWLRALPLTPNGKVDRRALAALEAPREERGERFAPPSTHLEAVVAKIWSEVLGRERVGIHDSFWEVGGHSLLATRVLARLNRTLGVELPLQALFLSPTVAGLSLAVGEVLLAEEGSPGGTESDWESAGGSPPAPEA